jgi:protein-tyrosine phosphatase
VLVECPLSNRPGEFEWPARALLERGVGVLLAHPERCPGFQRDLRRVSALVQRGALVQLTAGSIRGDFGAPARNAAFELARFGLVHDLASDAHDAVHRPPGLSAARSALAGVLKGGEAEAIWLTVDAPAAILAGRRPTGRPTASDPAASGRY